MKKLIAIFSMVIILIILDQVTKYLITDYYQYYIGESVTVVEGFFNFTYVQNPGAAFGFLAHAGESIRRPLFLFLPVLVTFWLIWMIFKIYKKNSLLTFSYALIVAGAVGNLIDRFRLGYVVDFFDFYWRQSHFPAFNIADSSITIAGGLLIIDFIIQAKKGQIDEDDASVQDAPRSFK